MYGHLASGLNLHVFFLDMLFLINVEKKFVFC